MIRQPCGQVAQLYPFLAGFRRERKDLRAYPHQTPSMIQEGLYRGGLVPFGYRLEHQGRVNKKNQPIRDLVIDERESTIVKGIFQRIVSDGWETNRIANWLNDRGIATKNGKSYWRATSI